MKQLVPVVGAVALTLALSLSASAQGVVRGAEEGAAAGAAAAGPVGGAVGGAVGGVVGGVAGAVGGLLGVEQRPAFREYVVREQVPSYRYQEEVRVGTVLPESGVTYREVPERFGARGSRYTVVNGRTVLVEPRTRRVIEVIE